MEEVTTRNAAVQIMEAELEKFHKDMSNLDPRINIACQMPGVVGKYIDARKVCNPYLNVEQIDDFNERFKDYLKEDLE